MRILSIDYDYFIDTDMDTRNLKFPNGVESPSKEILDLIWESHYSCYPELKNIGVIPEEKEFSAKLNTMFTGGIVISESHRDMEKLFKYIRHNEPLEVINIDFHHDNYISGGDNVDCANWVRHLMNLKPETNFLWVKRSDSDLDSLTGRFPYSYTDNLSNVKGDFDYTFMCFSPEWTPPHLRDDFLKMVDVILGSCNELICNKLWR